MVKASKNILLLLLQALISEFAALVLCVSTLKKRAFFYCFDVFIFLSTKSSTKIIIKYEFLPKVYNYGKNYPRSGIC